MGEEFSYVGNFAVDSMDRISLSVSPAAAGRYSEYSLE